jgi:hypothetical protein
MKYMLLIYGNEEAWSSMPPDEWRRLLDETDAHNRELFESGELVGAWGVGEPVDTKVVRVEDGERVVTDGPFLETKEYLGSFTIVDVDSLDRALEIAAANPSARLGGIEVKPLVTEADLDL